MKTTILLFCSLFLTSTFLIAQSAPNVSVRIAESAGNGCGSLTDCSNDIICFDVYFKVDQPNWTLQSYNIWMDYGPDNSVLSFNSEQPCHHSQGGAVNLDVFGKYRYLGALNALNLNANEEVIIQNFCMNIEDLQALDGFDLTAGGNHFGLVSSVNLTDQNNSQSAVNPLVPASSLTLSSSTLSCIVAEPQPSVRIVEATGDGCGNMTDCDDDVICFDVLFQVDQPNWDLQSYNIWMDYGPDNTVLSFSSEDPCYHAQGGAVDLDNMGKYRFLAALQALPLNANEEVIIHNFCLKIEDFQALDGFDVTAGGNHFGFVSSVNLTEQNNSQNAVNKLVPSSTLNLNSSTLSCFDPTTTVRIEEATGNGCFNQTDCENDQICFDVLMSTDQPNWTLASYNIWMDYGPNNAVLSFSSEDPCNHLKLGPINLDFLGKYRFMAGGGNTPLPVGQEVVVHNFCLNIEDLDALDGFVVKVGGDHWNLVSSAGLIDPSNSTNTANPHLDPYSLTLSSSTLSCLEGEAMAPKTFGDEMLEDNIFERSQTEFMRISPNPVLDELVITFADKSKVTNLEVYDLFGRSVKSLVNVQAGTSVNLNDLAAGVYLIVDPQGVEQSVKFIKK